jgi:hypothetical protein
VRPSHDLAIWRGAQYFPRCLLGTAPGLEGALIAIALAGDVKHRGTVVHQRSGRSEDLAAGTAIEVTCVVIGEVLARQGPDCVGPLVEHFNVWLDPVLTEQPAEHLGRATPAVAEEPARIEIEPFERALNNALGGQHFRLPDCRDRLDIEPE